MIEQKCQLPIEGNSIKQETFNLDFDVFKEGLWNDRNGEAKDRNGRGARGC